MNFKQITKRIKYLTKRHIFNQISTGDYGKICHFLKNSFSNKFFEHPRVAIIETGTTCNLKCPTCPTPRGVLNRPMMNMTYEELKKIVDNIKGYVHVALLYNSNEPLLHPDLPKMIKYAGDQDLYTMVSTNMMLLTREKTDELLNSGLDEILLCLDGMTKEVYEEFRGPGSDFETVIENIKYFCSEKKRRGLQKPYTELQFITTKQNQDQVPDIKKFAKEIGVDRLRVKSMSIGEYAYQGKERDDLMEKFIPTRSDAKTRFKKDAIVTPRDCMQPVTHATILANGDLVMCCYDIKGEYVYGNLLKESFNEVWFEKSKSSRIKAAKRKYPLCKICGNCWE
jgi:radical SAM protein with 4Fe4S-binding SPASM domain